MFVKVKCDYCGLEYGKDIRHVRYNLKINNKNYCSIDCQRLSRTSSLLLKCANCGTSIKVQLNRINKSKTGNVFCSKSCSTTYHNKERHGELHPSFKTGEGGYRKFALNEIGRACTVCGYDVVEVLEIHHKDGNRKHNKITNLDVLCPTHHKEYQLGIRKYV